MPASPSPNFDRLARPYRYLEYASFGPFLWRCRRAFLPQLGHPQQVLMAGEGDGRFLAAFLARYPHAHVDYYDLSPRMLDLARRRAHPHTHRVRFHAADLRTLPPLPARYDLICTHFFLDCFTDAELLPLLDHLARSATPHATWLLSEFHAASPLPRALVHALYLFFALTTGLPTRQLPRYAPALQQNHFTLTTHRPFLQGLLRAELWTRKTQLQPAHSAPSHQAV